MAKSPGSGWGTARVHPDSKPVIGQSRLHPRVFFAFGHGHLGLTLAAITARITANLILERHEPLKLAPFRAERF